MQIERAGKQRKILEILDVKAHIKAGQGNSKGSINESVLKLLSLRDEVEAIQKNTSLRTSEASVAIHNLRHTERSKVSTQKNIESKQDSKKQTTLIDLQLNDDIPFPKIKKRKKKLDDLNVINESNPNTRINHWVTTY